LATLSHTQESLERANQRLEEAFMESKRRFREKEQIWEAELEGFRQLLVAEQKTERSV
jgi:hypothetical protein